MRGRVEGILRGKQRQISCWLEAKNITIPATRAQFLAPQVVFQNCIISFPERDIDLASFSSIPGVSKDAIVFRLFEDINIWKARVQVEKNLEFHLAEVGMLF